MRRSLWVRALALVLGLGALVLGGVLAEAARPDRITTSIEGYYQPLSPDGVSQGLVTQEASSSTDYRWIAPTLARDSSPPPLTWDAYPGALALLLAGLLVAFAALSVGRRLVLVALTAGAIAAALAQEPALHLPVGSGLLRLAVVLGPPALALLIVRGLTGRWPWRSAIGSSSSR